MKFSYRVHHGILFFADELIKVDGRGTESAYVDFPGEKLSRRGPSSLVVTLPPPTLGVADGNPGDRLAGAVPPEPHAPSLPAG